jgi:hypothetical protein
MVNVTTLAGMQTDSVFYPLEAVHQDLILYKH